MDSNTFKERFATVYKSIKSNNDKSIPLCAAENCMSPFVKLPLASFIQEKYIMGGVLNYNNDNNFINSEELFNIYTMINDVCTELFNCCYADARTLSGINAVTTILMSVFKQGDTILISDENCGGHSSMPKICKRLGIYTIPIPYDYNNLDFDYDQANIIIKNNNVTGIFICLSDMITQPELYKFNIGNEITLLYDATQLLGLIATRLLPNPFSWFNCKQKFILLGATHKTIPGPSNGLILCNNLEFSHLFDEKINPDYLRNNQLHQILSLLFCLQELSQYGNKYMEKIVENANLLGEFLSQENFNLIKISKLKYTQTHQLFINLNEEMTSKFKQRAEYYDITLNARFKKLYKGSGIRLGLQEVSRYNWGYNEMKLISRILSLILNEITGGCNHEKTIRASITLLNENKNIHYTFSDKYINEFRNVLHD